MVRGLIEPRRRQLEAGRENALAVAVTDEDVGFVEGEEAPDAIAEPRGDIAGVIGERLGGLAPFPAAKPVLQGLRQVPVIERDVGGDSVREQRIDEAVVEVEALRIGRADAVGKDARPRNREAVGARAERLHERDVLLVAMIMVDRDVAGVAVRNSCRACGRSGPRSSSPCHPRSMRLRSGKPRSRFPRRTLSESSSTTTPRSVPASDRLRRLGCFPSGPTPYPLSPFSWDGSAALQVPEAPQGPPGVGRRKAGRSSPSAGLMETIVHQLRRRRIQPRRLFEAGAATALAEPKARKSARLRAGPIPEISSNGQTKRMLSLPVPASDPVAGVSGPLTSRWRGASPE